MGEKPQIPQMFGPQISQSKPIQNLCDWRNLRFPFQRPKTGLADRLAQKISDGSDMGHES